MANKPWFTANVHAPGTGVALALIALTLIPVAVVSMGQILCLSGKGAIGNGDPWTSYRVHYCNGGSR